MTRSRTLKLSRLALPGLILLLVAVVGAISPVFLTGTNLLNIITQSVTISLVAIGMTIVVLIGGIDLSVGALVAVCGVTAAVLLRQDIGAPAAVIFALLVGCALGACNGVAIGFIRVPPFIATLGMMGVARGLTLIVTDGRSIAGFDESFAAIAAQAWFGVPLPVLVLLFVSTLTAMFLRHTVWGVRLYGVGGNPRAAWLAGIVVPRYHVAAYAFSGLMAGIASIVLTARLNSALPTAGVGYELDAIAAVVIGGTPLSGGRGSVVRTVVGATLLGVLRNGLTILNVSPYVQQVTIGVLVIAAAALDMAASKGE